MYDLTIQLDPKSKTPLYEQIYSHIKREIQNGRMESGTRLPSTRVLCQYLEVSRSTVELAYEQLLSEGYLESAPRKGYFVAQLEGLYRITPRQEEHPKALQQEESACLYDFTPHGVDLHSFPYSTWRRLSREVLSSDETELFRLGDPQGEYGLRRAIAQYLRQARGVVCREEQVVVGAGSDYLFMLLTTILGNRHTIAMENPTYRQAYRLFERLSFSLCTIPMDESGMRADALEESGADIAFVMPSHQYPLGIVMPMRRRMELLSWADKEPGRYIIEDDYDSEYRYKGKPVPALQGYDRNGRVIYTGTFSKSIAPAIRMSYMVLPDDVLAVYREKCRFLSSTVSRADQMILQKFIEAGHYERHLNKMRALYRSRRDSLLVCLRAISAECGNFTISGENAGVHLLLHFPGERTEEELIEKAAAAGVKVYGLSGYNVAGLKQEENSPSGADAAEKEKESSSGEADAAEQNREDSPSGADAAEKEKEGSSGEAGAAEQNREGFPAKADAAEKEKENSAAGADPRREAVLLLGYANMDTAQIQEAAILLKKAWAVPEV